MQCIISLNLKCAFVAGLLSFLATCSVIVGALFVTINHTVDITRLQGILSDHNARIQQMKSYNERKFIETNDTIRYEIGTLRTETNDNFEATNRTLFSEVGQLRNETNTNFDDTNATLYSEIYTLRNETDVKIQNITIPSVAFEVTGVNDLRPQYDDTILFTEIEVNEGDCYNMSTGIFTAPVNGVYLFLIQVCINSGQALYIKILADNDVKQLRFYSYSSASCFTGSLVSRMANGTTASVVSTSNHGAVAFYSASGIDSTFSGFLINNVY